MMSPDGRGLAPFPGSRLSCRLGLGFLDCEILGLCFMRPMSFSNGPSPPPFNVCEIYKDGHLGGNPER